MNTERTIPYKTETESMLIYLGELLSLKYDLFSTEKCLKEALTFSIPKKFARPFLELLDLLHRKSLWELAKLEHNEIFQQKYSLVENIAKRLSRKAKEAGLEEQAFKIYHAVIEITQYLVREDPRFFMNHEEYRNIRFIVCKRHGELSFGDCPSCRDEEILDGFDVTYLSLKERLIYYELLINNVPHELTRYDDCYVQKKREEFTEKYYRFLDLFFKIYSSCLDPHNFYDLICYIWRRLIYHRLKKEAPPESFLKENITRLESWSLHNKEHWGLILLHAFTLLNLYARMNMRCEFIFFLDRLIYTIFFFYLKNKEKFLRVAENWYRFFARVDADEEEKRKALKGILASWIGDLEKIAAHPLEYSLEERLDAFFLFFWRCFLQTEFPLLYDIMFPDTAELSEIKLILRTGDTISDVLLAPMENFVSESANPNNIFNGDIDHVPV